MFRIRVVPLFLPPLREREGDVVALAWKFVDELNERGLRRVEEIDSEVVEALLSYRWPGNVRELHNVLQFAFAVGDGPLLRLDELPPELRGEPPPVNLVEQAEPTTHSLERERIVEALREAGGKKGEAAELLNMSRTTLWRKMRELGI
jgi:two-component system response regulator AtoC